MNFRLIIYGILLLLAMLISLVVGYTEITHSIMAGDIQSSGNFSNMTEADILLKTYQFIENQDPSVRGGLQIYSCGRDYQTVVQDMIVNKSYLTIPLEVRCDDPALTVLMFDKSKYDTIVAGATEYLIIGAIENLTAPVSNQTIVTPIPIGIVINPEELELIKNFTGISREQLIQALVQIQVDKQLQTIKCDYSEARLELVFQRWKNMNELDRKCLSMFITLNKTTPTDFAGRCASFGVYNAQSVDMNAYVNANYVLADYVANEFATVETKNMLINQIDPDTNTILQQMQRVSYYYPFELTQGCLLKFEDMKTKEASFFAAGWNNGWTWALVAGLIVLIVIWSFGNSPEG